MIYKLQLTLAISILLVLSGYGQNDTHEFGKIGKVEIELNQYALDKDAEAVVIFDIAKSFFIINDGSFDVIFERKTRIKILSESGVRWAEVEIPFYQEGDIYEKVYDIKANAFNIENGEMIKTPFNTSISFDEKINKYWNVKKFAISNVKEGTIVEYTYKIISPYKFNLRDWDFQWNIPVIYSEYLVKMIPFYEYTYLLQGANRFDSQSSKVDNHSPRQFGSVSFQDMVHTYVMRDIPAFNSEEFITSKNDYVVKLDFQLSKINYPSGGSSEILTTWEKMIEGFIKHSDFGKYIKKSEKLSSKLINIESLGLKTDTEKFDYALKYVKSNFNWDKYNSKYASKSPKQFIEEKFGNCADINLFTIGLLRALGIDAKPVLISTRDHGKIKYDYPYTHFFNYVIILAGVDGNNILTDATEVLSLNTRIPSRCINDKGLVIEEDKVDWVGLECQFLSEIRTDIEIEITGNEMINSSISKTSTEYDALDFRNTYAGKTTDFIIETLESSDFSIIDSTIKVKNELNIESPYVLTYRQTSKPEIVNEKIYISPFFNEPPSDNPLKQKERTYPMDMTYPKKRIFNTTILIPEGYQVEYISDEQKTDNQLFNLKYYTENEKGKIKVSFEYAFKKSVYSPGDYSKIKYYFNEIVKKGNEKIVLSKKK